MIRNERQYKITRSQAEHFRKSLAELRKDTQPSQRGAEPQLRLKLQEAALQSQLSDLEDELREYDALQSQQSTALEITSLDELPMVLVKARIAAGLTQKSLAEKLGLKEQQIQRYEANSYAGASLQRIQEVINALGVKIRKQLFRPELPATPDVLFQRMEEVGLDRDFVRRKLIDPEVRAHLEHLGPDNDVEGLVFNAAARIAKIFKWEPMTFFSHVPLSISAEPLALARFKLPKTATREKISAYTVYAHYLSLLLLQATPHVLARPIPSSWRHIRKQFADSYGEMTLQNLIRFVWDFGVVVLPLKDTGHFHGATWRLRGRNIILIKQKTSSEARWVIDLLHELWHAAQNPELSEHSVVELDPTDMSSEQLIEEQIATDFAADVVFGGNADALAEQCVVACNKRLEWLKAAVERVAEKNEVRTDLLANYMAYRLSLEGENWWGTASRLQQSVADPWETVRDFVVTHINWDALSATDRGLLAQALQTEESRYAQ